MKVKLFFNEISPEAIRDVQLTSNTFGSQIIPHFEGKVPPWKSADIALVWVGNSSDDDAAFFRKKLYSLSCTSKTVKIVDLGRLREGKDKPETCSRLSEVCQALMAEKTLPIILGSSHDLDLGQFGAYQLLEKIIAVLNVDCTFDISMEKGSTSEQNHIRQLLTQQPNILFDYAHIGYQRYLTPPATLNILENLNFELKSVGQMRQNIKEIEPIIRSADMVTFDLASLKTQGPATFFPSPFGLSPEEACQICWYAGLNEQLSSLGIYGLATQADQALSGTVAVMVWYFTEGFAHRAKEHNFQTNFHTKYLIPIEKSNQVIVFYKNNRTGTWWMETEAITEEEHLLRNKVVPCSYKDYQTACKGILPDRWLKAMGKIT